MAPARAASRDAPHDQSREEDARIVPTAEHARNTPSIAPGTSLSSTPSAPLALLIHADGDRRPAALSSAAISAPDWLKASAGRAYRQLPQGLRLGAGYEMLPRAAEGWPRRGARSSTLAWALETVPAYSEYRALPAATRIRARCWPSCPARHQARARAPLSRSLRLRRASSPHRLTRHPMRFFLQKHVTRPKARLHAGLPLGASAGRGDMVLALRAHRAHRRRGRWTPLDAGAHPAPADPATTSARYARYAEARPASPGVDRGVRRSIRSRAGSREPLPEFANVRGGMLFSENVSSAAREDPRGLLCPVIAHTAFRARARGGRRHRRPLLLLAAVRLPELVDERDRPIPSRGAWARGRHELRQRGDAVRPLSHWRPRGAPEMAAPASRLRRSHPRAQEFVSAATSRGSIRRWVAHCRPSRWRPSSRQAKPGELAQGCGRRLGAPASARTRRGRQDPGRLRGRGRQVAHIARTARQGAAHRRTSTCAILRRGRIGNRPTASS